MRSSYTHIIFDLDGTLVESAAEIHSAAAHVCFQEGLTIPTVDYIRAKTGNHPSTFFLDHGASENVVEQMVTNFRQKLQRDAGDPACVMDGAQELLARITSCGMWVSLATTKPTELAVLLLHRYGLHGFFDHVQGTDPPLRYKPHPDILNVCISRVPARRALMVGDTTLDLDAATNAGIDSAGICSGTHSIDLLSTRKPTFLLQQLGQLAEVLELP